MPQSMTTSQARVIDPILTTVARGYSNTELIGSALFPYVPVMQRGGKIIQFNKEDFRLYSTQRAPGANTKRISFGYAGAPYALESHSLEGQVPIEHMQDASAVPGIDLGGLAVQSVQNIFALRLEKAQADLATTAANYGASNKITLAGTAQWSDYTNSDPLADIAAGAEAIRSQIGRYPNTLALGPLVASKLFRHPKVIEAIFWANDKPGVVTESLFISLFPWLQTVKTGGGIYLTAADANADIWGKFAVLAYVDVSPLASRGSHGYGYTYRLDGYPIVEVPYFERNPKSWIYPVTDEVSPVIAGADAGYLISAAVA